MRGGGSNEEQARLPIKIDHTYHLGTSHQSTTSSQAGPFLYALVRSKPQTPTKVSNIGADRHRRWRHQALSDRPASSTRLSAIGNRFAGTRRLEAGRRILHGPKYKGVMMSIRERFLGSKRNSRRCDVGTCYGSFGEPWVPEDCTWEWWW